MKVTITIRKNGKVVSEEAKPIITVLGENYVLDKRAERGAR